MNIHFSSKTEKWETPQDFFDLLAIEFPFDVDVCASAENAKCPLYFSIENDGLSQDWGSRICWMNPPYGRTIGLWMRKAYEAAQRGATVVSLVPARTGSAWWHDYAMKAAEIRYLRGRLKFGGSKKDAPFPSAIAIFRPPFSLTQK